MKEVHGGAMEVTIGTGRSSLVLAGGTINPRDKQEEEVLPGPMCSGPTTLSTLLSQLH